LAACEGKKSLDGYPMDKPPPSAYGARDSEPVFSGPVAQEDEVVTVEGEADDEHEAAETESEEIVDETDEIEDESGMSEDEDEEA
jgi:hypothetical protein